MVTIVSDKSNGAGQVPGSLAMRHDLGGHAKVDLNSKAAEIMRTIPHQIADKLVAGLRRTRLSVKEAFEAIDKNGDGILQPEEFADGLRAMQVDLTDSQFQVVLSKFDEDENGALDVAEFKQFMSLLVDNRFAADGAVAKAPDESTKRVKKIIRNLPPHVVDPIMSALNKSSVSTSEVFRTIDRDNDNLLNPDELATGLKTLGVELTDAQLMIIFASFDKDGMGFLDARDFVQFLAILSSSWIEASTARTMRCPYSSDCRRCCSWCLPWRSKTSVSEAGVPGTAPVQKQRRSGSITAEHKTDEKDRGIVMSSASLRTTQKSFIPGHRFLLHPDGQVRKFWETYIGLAVLYSTFVVPIEVAFDKWLTTSVILRLLGYLVDVSFLCHMIVQFRTAYKKNLQTITNNRSIAIKYLKGWFTVDMLGTFPFEWFAPDTSAKGFKSLRMLRILRVLNLIKKASYSNWVGIVKATFYVFIQAEILGCLWFYIGELGGHPVDGFSPGSHHTLRYARCLLDNGTITNPVCVDAGGKEHMAATVDCSKFKMLNVGTAFLWSLHWGFRNLLSMGVNLEPLDIGELMLTFLCLMCGLFTFSYIVGHMYSLIQSLNVSRNEFTNLMLRINSWIEAREFTPHLGETNLFPRVLFAGISYLVSSTLSSNGNKRIVAARL
eukprot:SAG11_NODE_359_length_10228_cov_7.861388_8_plen_664_part_00